MLTKAFAVMSIVSAAAHAQISITHHARYVEAMARTSAIDDVYDGNTVGPWDHLVSETWGTGSNHMHQVSTFSNWELLCYMEGANTATTDEQAGWIYAGFHADFTLSKPMDVYLQGAFTGTLASEGGISLWNPITNISYFWTGGDLYAHLPAGSYSYDQSIDAHARGALSGDIHLTFRPGNDLCANAMPVAIGSYSGSLFNALSSTDGASGCVSTLYNSIWFSYTATRTGPLVLTTCGSSFDTVLTVFDNNSCQTSAAHVLACNDDAPLGSQCSSGTRQSYLSVNVTAGQSYLIRLAGYSNVTGDYRLNVGPVNDHCDNMIPATLGDNPFDNRLADTDGAVVNSCVISGDNQINGDLWYYYQPTHDGQLTVSTCGSGFDTKLAVYNGYSCGASGLMGCSDDACGTASRIENIPVLQGHWYTIRVGGFTTHRGAGNLNLAMSAACPADFNGDGVADFFDYLDFVSAFADNLAAADFNQDQVVDFFDYLDFVNAFSTGC